MTKKRIAICMVFIGMLILIGASALPVRAQEATPENDANCVSCHEHQYYVYDTGKWFCLCEAPMHCVYCHSGRTDSFVKEIAHEGMVLYPTRNHAERCQTCHNEDYMSRVVTFETKAGVSSTPIPIITATPFEPVTTLEKQKPALLLRIDQLGPWQMVGLGVLIVAFVGLLVFSYRCWKADCMARLKS